MRLPARISGAAAVLCLLLSLSLLLAFEDPRWGASALALFSSLAGAFALLEKRSAGAAGLTGEVSAPERSPDAGEREQSLPVHPVTGLYRLWIFRQRLDEEIARAARHHHELAVVLLEPVDLLWEPTPEAYARASKALRRALRTGDFAAQFDDERFVVLLPETERAQAQEAGRRMLSILRSSSEPPMRWRGALITYPEDGNDPDQLLDRAATALRRGRLESATRAAQQPDPEETPPETA